MSAYVKIVHFRELCVWQLNSFRVRSTMFFFTACLGNMREERRWKCHNRPTFFRSIVQGLCCSLVCLLDLIWWATDETNNHNQFRRKRLINVEFVYTWGLKRSRVREMFGSMKFLRRCRKCQHRDRKDLFCEPNRGVAIRRMSFWQLQRNDDGECASSSVSPTATENRKIESVFISDFITVVDNWRLFRWRVSTWKSFSRGHLPTRMWSKGDTGSFRAAHRMSNGSSGWTDDLRQHRDRKSARDRLWAFALNVVSR